MKQQIKHFSPHQNSKVIAILMAFVAVIFAMPFFMVMSLLIPAEHRANLWLVFLLPAIYFVVGYCCVMASCWFYNYMYWRVGGIEYEVEELPAMDTKI